MIARVIAFSVAALLGFASAAMADAPGTTGPIVVPPDEPTPPPPPPTPRSTTGTIELENWSVALGVGAVWGTGTVNYNGRNYNIKVGGFDLIDAGFAKSIGTGVVQNLESIEQIEGTYSIVNPGFAVIGGAGGWSMENDRGVLIGIHNYEIGARLGIGPGALTIQLR